MSVSVLANAIERPPAFQPFQCSICQSRFTRHENLKRHSAVHSRSQDVTSLSCDICNATFSRADLRVRHLKRKHPGQDDRPRKRRDTAARVGVAGDERERQQGTSPSTFPGSRNDSYLQPSDDESENSNQETRQGCRLDTTDPAGSTLLSNIQDYDQITADSSSLSASTDLSADSLLLASLLQPEGTFHDQMYATSIPNAPFETSLSNFNFDQWSPDRILSLELSQAYDDWTPSDSQTTRGCHLFFAHVSGFLPFLHQPSFNASQVAQSLLLSMLALAYQYGEDPDCHHEAGSGSTLSERCFRRARILIAADEKSAVRLTNSATVIQTYLLLEVFSMMYSGDDDSAYGLKTHSKIISLARASGMMQPIHTEATATQDLDSLWRHFILAESHKRTLFAVHQIDTLWYQFLSIPRLLSHLEIKLDLPHPEYYWSASSSGEWAHRQLIARQPGESIQYQDAIRRILSSGTDISAMPACDPYGTINITQFLVSSAREISGWSTMTGMLSMERLEPLRNSLLALRPLVYSQSKVSRPTHTALCEATWEMAMIEMQMWSPTHTGGIVEGSIDAALHQIIHFELSSELLCESNLAQSIQPHIDWFLRYLDETRLLESEAPWMTLYACKASMIAWQLVRGGVAGAMQVVGVADGDSQGALTWAKNVFQRRAQWKLGQIIVACLDRLES
ncbi:hypothetical protein EJ02DRAFT_34412 [Clathrospora elynae]|uniref:C2H2-type domain-containing protein n=1 Tax=Clathrospora elynae TaxID=706981 RepID=A0A6A5T113_9PLEO|nr:hypothetical protein EJ02DRAFT_34412 [Clathrospora elynae]